MLRLALVVLAVVAVASLSGHLAAGEKGIKVGDAAPTFTKLPGVDGKMHSLSDLKDKEVVVVCITCNHCPVAVAYEDRLIEFTKKHAGKDSKVAFVAINVNNLEADKLPKMKERAAERGFNFPYLHDESQQIAAKLGARVTPEFYVLNKDRKVVYMGAMDDNNNPKAVKTNFLVAAVEATLEGKTIEKTSTTARGCTIKWDK